MASDILPFVGARGSWGAMGEQVGQVFAPLIDPETATELHRHRQGDQVTMPIGASKNPALGGGPLTATGTTRRPSAWASPTSSVR